MLPSRFAGVAALSCGGGDRSRTRRLPIPGEQFSQGIDLRAAGDDALEHVGEVGLGIDLMQLGGVDQRGQDRPPLATAARPGEQRVFLPQRNRTDAAFDGVVVHLDPAVYQEA